MPAATRAFAPKTCRQPRRRLSLIPYKQIGKKSFKNPHFAFQLSTHLIGTPAPICRPIRTFPACSFRPIDVDLQAILQSANTMEAKQAERAIRIACAPGAIAAVLSIVSAIVGIADEGSVPLNPGVKIPFSPAYQFMNAALVAGFAVLIYQILSSQCSTKTSRSSPSMTPSA